MRTEDLKYGVTSILLVLGLVLSIILIAPIASSGDWVNEPAPGGTIIEVVPGENFVIRHVLEWDEAQDGAYTVTIAWTNYDNDPSENFTFLSAEAYFTTGPNAGEQTQADVMLASAPSGSDTSWALSVKRPVDNKTDKNGEFNVDIWMGAYGVGGVPHIQTDNHPILEQFAGVIVIESGLNFWNRAPITIKVLPPTGLLPHDPIYIDGNDDFTLANGVVAGSGTENDPYIIEGWDIDASGATGIYVSDTTDYFVIRNCVIQNGGPGIHFSSVIYGRIDNNTCSNNYEGIYLDYSANTLINNNLVENNDYGIRLQNSDNIKMRNNTLLNNQFYNFSVNGFEYPNFVHDIDSSNLVNGKPIRYLVDNKNEIIGPSLDTGYLGLVNCDNIRVENLALRNNGEGILLASTGNSRVMNCALKYNYSGIYFYYSDNNLIMNNVMENNFFGIDSWYSDNNLVTNNLVEKSYTGIRLVDSYNNLISNNIVKSNPYRGIYLGGSDNNLVTNNLLENNGYGIRLSANNNHIYHNNFMNNATQAYVDDGYNYWDDGYPSGGNYWSDYTGEDNYLGENQDILGSDGIGDTSYYIPGDNNRDRYPLMEPWMPRAPWPDYIIIQGNDTSYNQDKYPPAPSELYEPGDMPPIMAAKKVDPAGAVVIAGLGRTANGGVTYGNKRWESGELDVLLDKAFQWMVPGATKVLWYGDYGVSPGQYEYAYNDASTCSWLIDALENLGYVVDDTDDGTFTPITSSLLDPYDILILPGLQLGDGSPDGGDPDLLPDNIVATITDFVKTSPGKGLFLMESGDYDGYCFHRVQNKILEALEFGVFYQHDTVGDPETANNDSLKYVEVDVTANQFGSDYRDATGKTTIRLYKVPSLSVPGPGVVVEIKPEYQASTPGSTLTFSVTVTNTDALDDSYLLTVSDDAGWELALEDEFLMDVPGPEKSKTATLTVTIPSGAAISAEDNIRVKAESVVKAGVSDTDNCIVRAAMQIVPPIDDTQVVEGSPDTNYGRKTFMYMGSSTAGAYLDERVFLKFDLTGIPSIIPPGDWVAADLHARLHVYCFTMSGAIGKNVQIRNLDNDNWDEAEITWNDYPAYGSVLDTRAVTEAGWHSWDVTSHVQNQFTGDKIASFCMTAETENLGYPDNFSYGFNTKEADVKFWPYLEFVLPYKVDVSIKPWIQDSSPGSTLTYTVIVTNKGSETDNYSLSVTDTQGWGPVIAQNLFTNVQHGESRTTTLAVTIPSDVSPCTKDTITITATSQVDPTVGDSANCIAHAFEGAKLLPTDDAHVSSGNEHINYGGEDTLFLQSDTMGYKNQRIFLKFDLSTVPSGSTITEAEVWLWSRKAEFADINAQCWSVTDDALVDEDLITWGTQPAHVAVLDTVPLKYSPPSEDMWLLWNVTSFVQEQRGVDNIASFCIRAEVESASGRYGFASKEWPRENERPHLKITYVETQLWDAQITATFPDGRDDAIFGVRLDATAGFDSAYDIPEPPVPVEPPYVQAFFPYPGNAPLPTTLHRSCIPPGDTMEWPLRVSYRDGTDNITLSWNLENVPPDYAVLLFNGENLIVDMRAVDNYTFQAASGDFDLTTLVTVDTTPPTSSVNAISPYWQTSSSFVTTATASDALSGVARVALWYRYSNDNLTWSAWTWFETDNVPPWSWTFTSPNGNGYYGFYSRARDVARNEENAPVTADAICGVDNVAPTKPSELTPSGGVWLNDNAPLLSWGAASDNLSGVDYYEILVDDNSDFSSPENTGTTTSTYYTVGNELKEGAQYWQVRAVDKASNVGAWENDWFRIDVSPPGKPGLASPENKTVMNIASVSFTWTEPESGVTYHIQIDNEASFTSPYVHENTAVTDNSYSYTLPTDGTYYWQVSAIDAANNESLFADNYNFTIVTRGVDVFISLSYQSGLPGATLSYTVTVTNTGTVSDNYDLTADDNANWSLTLPETLTDVIPGESRTVILGVGIPDNAENCTNDNITVTATSMDNAVSDSASCIAHVELVPVCGVDVTLEPKHQRGTPGTELTFLVTIHNTGNIEDNYHLWVENDGWPSENIWLENGQPENIKPGESKVSKLHVRIPENAEPCTHKEIVVVAESKTCHETDNDNALIQVVSAYLHSLWGLINLENVDSFMYSPWHELYPNFSKRYHLTSWEDTNGDGKLSPSDQIDMTDNETGEVDNYHVKDVTVTIFISKKWDFIENTYVEFEGDFEDWDNLKKDPVSTQWHEIWPVFSKRYHLVSWEDENWDGALGPSDQIGMMDKENGETYWYHVDEVAIDIILCKKLAVGPSAPILKSPADGTITNDNTPTFEWTVGSNADNHRLLVDDDPGFTSPIENRLFGPTDNTYTPALENSFPDDNYSWKVIAISAVGENQSSVWTFVIDTVSPAAPSLISPANGTITDDNTPTFDWSDVAGAKNYDLLIDGIQVTISVSTYTPTAELPDGTYSWKVRARDAAGNVGDWSSTWTLIISVARGVDVYISPSYQSGLPGATLSYSVTVKNEGNISDTFDLTATDSAGWGPTLSRYSLAIPPKAYDTVALAVTIPTDASVGDQDNITITAESIKDPTVSDSARCTAQATAIRRRVEVSISPESKSGPPGEKLTYTVIVLNEGDAEDTYDLAVVDDLTWGATVSPTSLTIAAGRSDTATLSATIPAGTASGTEDEITVTATSRADLRVSDSTTCIARAAAVRGVEVSISPENQSGTPEEVLTYTVTVKNEGNVGDTYILSTAGAPDWSPRIENTSLTLSAGSAGETTLTIMIPPGASEGTSITVNVTAISVGDPRVVGSDTCRAIVKPEPIVPEELLIPLAISAFLIVAAILTAAYLLHVRRKRAARRRVLRGPRRF